MEFILRGVGGKQEWVVLQDHDYLREIGRAAYTDMLHDEDRNSKYESAIKEAVEETHKLGKEAVVLDIGTGTGLLSIFAIRAGAERVYACDGFLPMLNCGKKVTSRNGCEKIRLIHKRSTDMKVGQDIPERCNILITEVFDTELIGEGAVNTYNHALQHLMLPDPVCVPHSALVKLYFMNSPLIERFNSFDGSVVGNLIGEAALKETKHCQGVNSCMDIQASRVKKPIQGELRDAFRFEFSDLLPTHRSRTFPLETEYNACILFWTLKMSKFSAPEISCAPSWIDPAAPWRDHWIQAAYFIPQNLRSNPTFNHDEFSYWFGPTQSHPSCICSYHYKLSRPRFLSLNKTDYNKISASIPSYETLIIISDNSLLPLCLLGKGMILNFTSEQIFVHPEITQSNDASELAGLIKGRTCVLTDVYFSGVLDPIDAYNHFLQKLEELKLIDAKVCPSLTLEMASVTFHDLQKIRSRVGSTCSVDLTDFDDLIIPVIEELDEGETHYLWEYAFDLHQRFKFDLGSDFNEVIHCNQGNALVYWVESWTEAFLNGEFDKSIIQGVKFFSGGKKTFNIRKKHNLILK